MEYQFKTRNELMKYQKQETKKLFLSVPSSGKNTHQQTEVYKYGKA